jgi:allantoin racemase
MSSVRERVLSRPTVVLPLRIALINPNTNTQATELMLASARKGLPSHVRIEGHTVRQGPSFITDEAALEQAEPFVVDFGVELASGDFDALIIAGFGEPGVDALRRRIGIPVVGIAQAGIAEAAGAGRRYAIVTVTPELHASLLLSAQTHGNAGTLTSIRFTDGPLADVMQTPQQLADALLKACELAVQEDGAQAVVIGGGPLAQAAQALSEKLHVPVIDPVAAAVRMVLKLLTR